jgi:hypothetical protein
MCDVCVVGIQSWIDGHMGIDVTAREVSVLRCERVPRDND